MTGWIIRILIIALLGLFVYFGVRRIWRDWQRKFRKEDEERLVRDRRERDRPEVITLERDKDGTFRPPEDRDRR